MQHKIVIVTENDSTLSALDIVITALKATDPTLHDTVCDSDDPQSEQSEPADALKQWVKDYIEEQGFVDEDRAREISEELDVTDAVTEEIDNRELISRDDIEHHMHDFIDNIDWDSVIENNHIATRTDVAKFYIEEKVRVALISLLSADEEESSDDDESDDDE